MNKPYLLLPAWHKRPPIAWLRRSSLAVRSAAALLLLLGACEKPDLEPAQASTSARASQADLNAKNKDNPFTVQVMRKALKKLQEKKGGGDFASIMQAPTHYYVRFKPANTDQLADLDDLGLQLSFEPLDEGVASYTTVDYTSSDIAWVYTAVPTYVTLPGHIQQEKIADLYLFYEEDGDIYDQDPWEPDPEPDPCTPVYDPNCNCYIPCEQNIAGPSIQSQLNNMKKATDELKRAGIAPLALYNEAMRLTGHEDEMLPNPEEGDITTQHHNGRYHPSGQIQVQETDGYTYIPLRGVEVKSRRWFQLGSTFTDSQGNFAISTTYAKMAKLSLQFKNNLATTRGIVSGLRVWQAVLPITSELGTYTGTAMQGLYHPVPFVGGLDQRGSKGASVWSAATLFNTLADEQTFSAARQILPPPNGLNVWLFPDFPFSDKSPGAAPMLRKIASTAPQSAVIDFLLIASGMGELALIKQILQRQLPDITVRYVGDQGAYATHQLVPLFYHELGHAQHYRLAGNSFWNSYIDYIVDHGGYGEKSFFDSGRIAVSEGWGNYIEGVFTIDKYTGTPRSSRADGALAYLENQTPSDNNAEYNRGWLVYGMYHDMTDNTTEPPSTGVTDNVTAYTTSTVFGGLQSHVASVRAYQNAINSQNSGLQSFAMDQLVTSYRW